MDNMIGLYAGAGGMLLLFVGFLVVAYLAKAASTRPVVAPTITATGPRITEETQQMIRTDREAFIARTKELAAQLSRISQPLPPPNMAWNQKTGKWEAPKSSLTNAIAWDDGDDDDDFGMDDGILTADYCTPSRHRSLTAQPQARPRAITYAQDVDLHPELDVPVPPPAKPERAPVPVPPPAPDPDAPIPAPWWPVRERQEAQP